MLILLTILILAPLQVHAAGLNDTGITTCSNASQNGLPCPVAGFPGQDAEYGTNSFDFTKLDANGNAMSVAATNHGCVQDNVTGLMWEVATHEANFDNAASFATQANATNLCGYNDWRIPEPHELASIMDYSVYDPSIDEGFFPNTPSDYFWTNSPHLYDPSTYSWIVNFYGGYVNDGDRNNSNFVRCVRAGQWLFPFSFTDQGDGTVTEQNTGLMWAKCSVGQGATDCSGSASNLTWQQALQAADNSTLAGYTDWRLPNVKELQTVVDYTKYNPAINSTYFPNTPTSDWFWTSSPYKNCAYCSWIVYFANGGVDYHNRYGSDFVRCVRMGQWLFSFSLSVAKAGNGVGSVSSNPAGINCGGSTGSPNDCSENYASGTVVALTATPAAGSNFAGWSGDADCNDGTVTMDAAKNCTATFNLSITAPTVTTGTVSNITQTSATLNGTVISSGATATVSFEFGTTTAYGTNIAATPSNVYSSTAIAVSANVSTPSPLVGEGRDGGVTPSPLSGGRLGWGGNSLPHKGGGNKALACGSTYHYRVKAVNTAGTSLGTNQSFTTADCPTHTLIITKQGTGTGSVTSTPAGINCGATCSANFAINTSITLTATPNTGSAFGGFSGATDCNDGYITMDTGKNCIATFNPQPINGACGSSNSNSFDTAPAANLCSTGTASAVTGTGPWNWSCAGSNGGTNASCSANITRYTATATVGTGGTVNPGTITVNYATTASFTVTANNGYSINTAVGGTCPPGTWNGNIWTTGAITADCSVNFIFNPIITAPTVTTGTASNITQTSATLNGTVISSGSTATVSFDFGTTTAYGTNIAATPGSVYSSTAVAVTANVSTLPNLTPSPLSGLGWVDKNASFLPPTLTLPHKGGGNKALACGTTYHYRVKAVNTAGTGYGTDKIFTTTTCPPINSWLYPTIVKTPRDKRFTLTVTAKSDGMQITNYDYTITFDPNKLLLVYSECDNGVCLGANNTLTINSVYPNYTNSIRIKSLGGATIAGNDLQLLIVHFKTRTTLGATTVTLYTNALENTSGDTIGLGAAGATINISTGICGDANGDTTVNIIDALAIARKVVGLPPPPTIEPLWADVNYDSNASIIDALHISRYSIGLVLPPEVCAIGQAL